MIKRMIAFGICVAIGMSVLGCNSSGGGGGSDEEGKAKIDETVKIMQEKKKAEGQ